MRVGIDFRPCIKQNSRRRGIGKFTSQLVQHLLESDDRNHYLLYSCAGMEPSSANGRANLEVRSMPRIRRPERLNWLLDRVALPACLYRDRIDIFHATDFTSIPRSSSARVWAYVHDLIPFLFWDEIRPTLPADYAWALKSALERARASDLIITVSEHSRRDICERLQLAPERVKVVYQGCEANLRPRDLDESRRILAQRYRIAGPFVFYVGGSDFRKNLTRWIRAFGQIRRRGYQGKMVFAGETFEWDIPEVAEIRRQVEQSRLEESVLFPGYVPSHELDCFYSACDLFVFPSLYEGFGIPLVEAMKCGASLLVSKSSSLPEVAGTAAVYFDPRDEDSMAAAFFKLYGAPERQVKLRELGFRRAKRFNWPKAAMRIQSWMKGQGGDGPPDQAEREA